MVDTAQGERIVVVGETESRADRHSIAECAIVGMCSSPSYLRQLNDFLQYTTRGQRNTNRESGTNHNQELDQ